MQYKWIRHRRGFTLIEVLVVVAIIALLIAILLPSLARAREQARGLRCLANMKQIGNAMAFYSNDNRSNYLPPFTYPFPNYRFRNNSNTMTTHDPYWFEYLPNKYLASQYEVTVCPSDDTLVTNGRFNGWEDLNSGAFKVSFSYGMNEALPAPDYYTTPPHQYHPTYKDMAALNLLKDTTYRYSPTSLQYIKSGAATDYLTETIQHDQLSAISTKGQFRPDHGGRKDRINMLYVDTHAENKLFTKIWLGGYQGQPNAGLLSDPTSNCPGWLRQLWFGSPTATTQILY